jgi:hypothetical protein
MIKGPKNAIPTLKGWVSPKGELLKSQRITQKQIDEWYGKKEPAPVMEQVADVVYGGEAVEVVEVEEKEAESVPSEAKPGLFSRIFKR